MKFPTKTALVSLGLLLGSSLSRSSLAEEPLLSPHSEASWELRSAEADRLFREGRAALLKEKWAEGRRLLLQSFAIKRSFDTAANLAVAAWSLRQLPETARYSWFSLSQFPATAEPAKREELSSYYEASRKEVAQLHILSQPGVQILIDSKPLNELAEPGDPVFLASGKVRVEASLIGHQSQVLEVKLNAGEDVSLKLYLKPSSPLKMGSSDGSPGVGSPAQSQDSSLRPQSERPSLVPVMVSGGITLVSTGIAVGLRLVGDSAARQADQRQPSLANYDCRAPRNFAPCEGIRQDFQRADDFRNASTVGFLVGGVGLAATGVASYLYWRHFRNYRKEAAGHASLHRANWSALPVARPEQIGIILMGAF